MCKKITSRLISDYFLDQFIQKILLAGVLLIVDAVSMTEIGRANVSINIPFGFHNRFFTMKNSMENLDPKANLKTPKAMWYANRLTATTTQSYRRTNRTASSKIY